MLIVLPYPLMMMMMMMMMMGNSDNDADNDDTYMLWYDIMAYSKNSKKLFNVVLLSTRSGNIDLVPWTPEGDVGNCQT